MTFINLDAEHSAYSKILNADPTPPLDRSSDNVTKRKKLKISRPISDYDDDEEINVSKPIVTRKTSVTKVVKQREVLSFYTL